MTRTHSPFDRELTAVGVGPECERNVPHASALMKHPAAGRSTCGDHVS